MITINKILIIKFIKYCLIGFSGMIIDFGVTYILKEIIKINKFIANAIGFTIAATYNYYLNRIWTFHSHNPDIAIEYSKFLIISLIGLLINTVFLWFFNNKAKLNFYFAKFVAIVIVTIWNFFANLLYTFL